MLLIFTNGAKAFWQLLFPVAEYFYYGLFPSEHPFCQATGFFMALFIETAGIYSPYCYTVGSHLTITQICLALLSLFTPYSLSSHEVLLMDKAAYTHTENTLMPWSSLFQLSSPVSLLQTNTVDTQLKAQSATSLRGQSGFSL